MNRKLPYVLLISFIAFVLALGSAYAAEENKPGDLVLSQAFCSSSSAYLEVITVAQKHGPKAAGAAFVALIESSECVRVQTPLLVMLDEPASAVLSVQDLWLQVWRVIDQQGVIHFVVMEQPAPAEA